MQFGDMVQPRTSPYIRTPYQPHTLVGLYFNLVCVNATFYFLRFSEQDLLVTSFCSDVYFSMNYLNWDMQFMLGLSTAARFVTIFFLLSSHINHTLSRDST